MGYTNGQFESDLPSGKGVRGETGLPGIGFNLTDDGDFDIEKKRLTDVGDPTDDKDAATKKYVDENKLDRNDLVLRDGSQNMTGNLDLNGKKVVNLADSTDDGDAVNLSQLKNYTQFQQNNYHLQPSFRFFKEYGDNAEIDPVYFAPPQNPDPDIFFHNHKDCYIIPKEDYGFNDMAWANLKLTNDMLDVGNYTLIFEIFTGTANPNAPPAIKIVTDESLIFDLKGDSHFKILKYDDNRVNNQYTRSYIQFHSDGQSGGEINMIK